MEKIFYTAKSAYPSTHCAVQKILSECFGVTNAEISRTENGKPFLKNCPLFFSVSHTQDNLFIAFSDTNVGIDAEPFNRTTDYLSIVKKFPMEERAEICSQEDFLHHWTAKESAIKWLGGKLSQNLFVLAFIDGVMKYGAIELPSPIFFQLQDCLVAISCERDFSQAELIPF